MVKITVLRSTWSRAFSAKRFFLDEMGGIKSKEYEWGKEASPEVQEVGGLEGLAGLLGELQEDTKAIIVPGTPNPDLALISRKMRGETPGLLDYDRSWLVIDLDKMPAREGIANKSEAEIKAALLQMRAKLIPEPFASAACVAQFSSSAFVAGVVGVHLWFVADRAFSNASARAYFREQKKQFAYIDPAIYAANQPHYIARPHFDPAHLDPFGALPRLYSLEGEGLVLPEVIRDSAGHALLLDEKRAGSAPIPAALRCRGQAQDRYAEKILDNLTEAIGGAGKGERHETMLRRIHAAAAYVLEGYFSRADLLDAVIEGMRAWGPPSAKDYKKAESMLDDSLARVGALPASVGGGRVLSFAGLRPKPIQPKDPIQPKERPLAAPLDPGAFPFEPLDCMRRHYREAVDILREHLADCEMFGYWLHRLWHRTPTTKKRGLCLALLPLLSDPSLDQAERTKRCFVSYFPTEPEALALLQGGV